MSLFSDINTRENNRKSWIGDWLFSIFPTCQVFITESKNTVNVSYCFYQIIVRGHSSATNFHVFILIKTLFPAFQSARCFINQTDTSATQTTNRSFVGLATFLMILLPSISWTTLLWGPTEPGSAEVTSTVGRRNQQVVVCWLTAA